VPLVRTKVKRAPGNNRALAVFRQGALAQAAPMLVRAPRIVLPAAVVPVPEQIARGPLAERAAEIASATEVYRQARLLVPGAAH
jgi:hypothetical protein